MIMAGVVAAVVLSLVIFFRVNTIQVTGGQYYTAEEIIAASGVAKGDNLLTISRAGIAGNIVAELPYVRSVQITRHLPDTLELTVEEYDVTYAVRGSGEDYYLITAGGKITEKVDEHTARSHIRVDSLTLDDPVVGQTIKVAGAENELAAQGQIDAMCALLQELESAELSKQVVSVEVPSAYHMALWYGDQYYVKLGDAEDLPYKLEYLKKVLEKLEDYQTGTIDLSFSEGSEARFTPSQ